MQNRYPTEVKQLINAVLTSPGVYQEIGDQS